MSVNMKRIAVIAAGALLLAALPPTEIKKVADGANPGGISVGQPTKFELAINMKTARAIGLTIPQSLLMRADEVMQ